MTKARIAIYAGIFLAFLLIGFGLAYLIRYRMVLPVASAPSVSPLPANSQQNLLVIHVDDLSKSNPNLISVWVVFFAQYDQTFISFKALYPDPLSPRPIIPVNVFFSLNEDGLPSQAFFKWVRDHELDWEAHVLIDQDGLEHIAEYIKVPELDYIIPRNKDQLQAVWQQEAQVMDRICLQLLPNKLEGQKFDWDAIIPRHMRTDLSFEDAILVWDQMNKNSSSVQCQVYGLN
jgi:hypothetical protein